MRVLKRHYNGLHATAVEIQSRFCADLEKCADRTLITEFLTVELGPSFDLVVSNPPFSQAQSFIEKTLTLLTNDGIAAFLLRLPFAGSVKRYSFFQKSRPAHIRVLSQRPKFGGDNIDSCDYAWFVWSTTRPSITTFDWIEPA